jgi:hypothetical protein
MPKKKKPPGRTPARVRDIRQIRRIEEKLTAFGAPFLAPPRKSRESIERILSASLALSHESSQLASVLPYVLWLNRDRIDLERLVSEAKKQDERRALGLFLEIAGRLGRSPELVLAARGLRDRRRRRVRQYFTRSTGRWAMALARRNTPSAARRWGYLMNMPLDSFASVFQTFAP